MSSWILPPLPYHYAALQPHISEETLKFHYDQHHQSYVTKLNQLAPKKIDDTLEDVMCHAYAQKNMPVFNNSAQVWNHTFYWNSMRPHGGDAPSDDGLMQLIVKSFHNLENFHTQFTHSALSQFGSGWTWICLNSATHLIEIISTSNADNPMLNGLRPLAVCDVWEHAYYLDHQNRRVDHVESFLHRLINWSFVAQNLTQLWKWA